MGNAIPCVQGAPPLGCELCDTRKAKDKSLRRQIVNFRARDDFAKAHYRPIKLPPRGVLSHAAYDAPTDAWAATSSRTSPSPGRSLLSATTSLDSSRITPFEPLRIVPVGGVQPLRDVVGPRSRGTPPSALAASPSSPRAVSAPQGSLLKSADTSMASVTRDGSPTEKHYRHTNTSPLQFRTRLLDST